MSAPFQVYRSRDGDLYMVEGKAWQQSTGTLISIAERGYPVTVLSSLGEIGPPQSINPLTGLLPATAPEKIHRTEGSGRNLILNAADAAVCEEWQRLPRVFHPGDVADTWVSGYWTITKTGASTAELSDQVGVIASMTSGTAPYGTYTASTTGEDEYNSSVTWNVTATAESAGNYLTAAIAAMEGSFPDNELFASADGVTWAFPVDTLVSVVVAGDGSADLFYDTDLIAERAAGGSTTSPEGLYTATATGETNYNSGDPWTAYITANPVAPRGGWIYCQLIYSSGTLTELRGPYFASGLPSNTTDIKHIPIAYSNGTGTLTQHHTGLIILP